MIDDLTEEDKKAVLIGAILSSIRLQRLHGYYAGNPEQRNQLLNWLNVHRNGEALIGKEASDVMLEVGLDLIKEKS